MIISGITEHTKDRIELVLLKGAAIWHSDVMHIPDGDNLHIIEVYDMGDVYAWWDGLDFAIQLLNNTTCGAVLSRTEFISVAI